MADQGTEVESASLSEPDIIEAGATGMAHCIDVMEGQFKLLGAGGYRMSGKNKNKNGHGALACAPSDMFADEGPFVDCSWKCVTDLYPMYEGWRDGIGHFDVCGTLGNEWADMVDGGGLPRESVAGLGVRLKLWDKPALA